MYKDLNREKRGQRIIPNSEDSTKFWSDIWSIRKEHNQHAEWLKSYIKQFDNINSMEKVEISQEMVKMQCRKMPNWKTPGKDGVEGYWLKNLTSLHPRISVQLNQILGGDDLWKDSTCAKKIRQKEVQLIAIDQYPTCP